MSNRNIQGNHRRNNESIRGDTTGEATSEGVLDQDGTFRDVRNKVCKASRSITGRADNVTF